MTRDMLYAVLFNLGSLAAESFKAENFKSPAAPMDSPPSSESDFEAVSAHLHSLQVSHDLLHQRVLYLEERVRALEDERPAVQARLSWLEGLLQRLRQCFQ